jgi:nitroreductase
MFTTFTDELAERVVRAACAAPSLHNSQPWQFEVAGDELRLHAVPDRALPVADPAARGLYISCGAALFNARVAARVHGLDSDVTLLPHPDYPFDVLAVMRVRPGRGPTDAEKRLYESIWRRHTDRRPYSSRQVAPILAAGLGNAAEAEGASLRMLNRHDTSIVLGLAAQAGRELASDRSHQDELRRWIGDGQADGIPRWALPAPPRRAPSPVRDADFLAAAGTNGHAPDAYERHPQVAVLTTEHDEPDDWLRAGEALQNVLLVATSNGLSASFLCQPIERDDMRASSEQAWPWPEHPQMIIRLGYGLSTRATPRRPVEDAMQATEQLRLGGLP